MPIPSDYHNCIISVYQHVPRAITFNIITYTFFLEL